MADNTRNEEPKPDSRIDHASAIKYWNSRPPTVNGMLGGFPEISNIDLRGSATFLAKLRRLIPSLGNAKLERGVDCGAGIGRITEGFLSKVCDVVDVVEPVEKFASVIRDGKLKQEGKVGDIYVTGLEDWRPSKQYDLIWNQWVLSHLTDEQLVDYLVRCRGSLSETGLVVAKENINLYGSDAFDETDNSVTRTEATYRDLFERSGFTVIRSEEQHGFRSRLPLYPVKFFALRPK